MRQWISGLWQIVCWYGHVLRRALQIEVDRQRKKGRLKWMWKKQVEKEGMKVGLSREDVLRTSKWIAARLM